MEHIETLLHKNKHENLLVYTLVFLAVWDFTHGFTAYTGGGLGPLFVSLRLKLLLNLFIFGLLWYHYSNRKYSFNKTETNVNVAIVFTLAYIFYLSKELFSLNFFGVLMLPLQVFILYSFLILRENLKVRILDGFIRVIAIILFLSVVEYLIYIFTDQRYILYSDLFYLDKRPYYQTLFNLMPQSNAMAIFNNMYRFQSVAEEPGGVGTLCSFLLFATCGCKKYRFHYIVFWVAGLLSFSLAFYIMAFIHVVSFYISNRNFWPIIIIITIISLVLYFFQDGFEMAVLDRISGKSLDEIDNRTAANFQRAYDKAWDDGTIWFGYGTNTSAIETDGGTAGARKMIFQYGVFRTIAIVIAYIYCYLKTIPKMNRKSKLMAFSFLLVFWISFYQRHYILSFVYILPYFVMPYFISYKEKINSHIENGNNG